MAAVLAAAACSKGSATAEQNPPPCDGGSCATSPDGGNPDGGSPDGGNPDGGTLVWTPPSTNSDGTPLTDLAGYKLHYDTTGRGNNAHYAYANVVDLHAASCAAADGGGTECTATLPALGAPAGTTWYFAVTAYDHATPPNESAYGNELVVTR
jgi:hypothetical protein